MYEEIPIQGTELFLNKNIKVDDDAEAMNFFF